MKKREFMPPYSLQYVRDNLGTITTALIIRDIKRQYNRGQLRDAYIEELRAHIRTLETRYSKGVTA